MNKFFDSHWALRITALILAILLFFYINSTMDNSEESTSNTEVDILKDVPLEVYYDEENFIVSGLPKTVDVTIEGPLQIVTKTKLMKDYKVFVDLNSLMLGEHTVEIQHENFLDKLDVSIEPKTVNVSIEEKVTQEFKVEPQINTQLIASDHVLQSMTADPSTVFVTGAKSVVESISYVKATVTGDKEIEESFEQEANVKVLDSNLNKLDVSIEPEDVNVKVEVKPYSRVVPIKIEKVGTSPEGVTIDNLSSNIESVEVFGPKSIIDLLTELVVEFDVSKIEKSGKYEVDLEVPNGATKLSTNKITIDVTATNENNDTDNTDSET